MEKNQKTLLIGLTVLIFGFFIIGSTVQLPYSAQVTKMVREPYEDKECKQVPYQVTDEVALTYKVLDHGQTGGMSGFLNYVTKGWIQIENTDDESGTFKISCKFQTLDGTFTDSDSVFINPGELNVANCQADTSLGQDTKFSYVISPGTKTVIKTEYREECEWVTKYRDVQKEVTETRYHTIFQSWFGD